MQSEIDAIFGKTKQELQKHPNEKGITFKQVGLH